jgi:hypothetical protein
MNQGHESVPQIVKTKFSNAAHFKNGFETAFHSMTLTLRTTY